MPKTTARASGPSNVTFPLPPDKVPKITLSDADVAEYKRISRDIVAATLGMEIQYRFRELAMLNPQDWKFVKAKERFRVYKRVTPDNELVSMVLGVGFMEGSLENVFYGLHHKTTEEMRMTTTFVNKNILDTAEPKQLLSEQYEARDSGESAHSSASSDAFVVSGGGSVRGALCALCHKKPPLLRFSCKPCRICREPVCSRCYFKPTVLAVPRNFRILCCKACVVRSREIPVDPRDPYPIINGSQFQKRRSMRATATSREGSRTIDTDY
ncbi:hypothetical protein PybrP1_003588 [[Pythium] brassicae (nom. inval.)]|nr:hypothetical protein PybrP1_003588 [[Pythium] brassicae (nom. inval.)]